MCRLTAYLGAPLRADALVFGGSHSLYEQSYLPRELIHGSVNADGYGVAWYRDHTPVRIGGTRPIWQDGELRGVLESSTSQMILAAVRNATPGIPVDDSGNLPLTHGRWSFILNGFVEDFRASYMRTLRSGLPDDLYGELRGSSDSETLFLLAVSALRDNASLAGALEHVRNVVLEVLRTDHESGRFAGFYKFVYSVRLAIGFDDVPVTVIAVGNQHCPSFCEPIAGIDDVGVGKLNSLSIRECGNRVVFKGHHVRFSRV